MTYAIVKTGGKQYRVEPGQSLLVERLAAGEGDTVTLEPLLFRGDDKVVTDGDDLEKVKVEAKVLAHERGPRLRVVKFKPKKGYKRRTGHRQDLTRLEVTDVKLLSRKPAAKKEGASKPADKKEAASKPAPKQRSRKPAAEKKEASDGS